MPKFSKNHFDLFGLPVSFVVDATALAERYRDLQRVVHPDRYASATEQEKRLSLQQATRVNEAFGVLKDPLQRATYLLSLHGVDTDPREATVTDAAFLMEQMELREELAEVRAAADPAAALQGLLQRVGRMISSLVGQLAMHFEEGTPEALERVREGVGKLQFLNKLYAEAEALEAELEENS